MKEGGWSINAEMERTMQLILNQQAQSLPASPHSERGGCSLCKENVKWT